MPYQLVKTGTKYAVVGVLPPHCVFSYHTTRKKAQAQVRLLEHLEAGKLYFHFHANDVDFHHELHTERCQALNAKGQRCGNRVTIGLPYCWIHERYQQHLKIAPSSISNAGKGVYAVNPKLAENAVIFKKGETICQYIGENITPEETEHRYGDHVAPYGLRINQRLNVDAATMRGIGSMINHKAISKTNCRFSVNARNQIAKIVATKIIRNGQELFIHYGNQYEMNEAGVRYATNARKYFL